MSERGTHPLYYKKGLPMKKALVIKYSYRVNGRGAGIFVAGYSVGLADLNEQTDRFSDKKKGISIRFFAINHGVCIHGSINGSPMAEENLCATAEQFIAICCGNDLVSWEKQQGFHLASATAPQRDQPLFGLPAREVVVSRRCA